MSEDGMAGLSGRDTESYANPESQDKYKNKAIILTEELDKVYRVLSHTSIDGNASILMRLRESVKLAIELYGEKK